MFWRVVNWAGPLIQRSRPVLTVILVALSVFAAVSGWGLGAWVFPISIASLWGDEVAKWLGRSR